VGGVCRLMLLADAHVSLQARLKPPAPAMQASQAVQTKKGDVPGQPRGIFTSPAKKGTFGFDNLTLSQRAGVKGVAAE
jgi:hypothetical protein